MVSIYGIVSDVHKSDPLKVQEAFNFLKKAGAQKLILNGDIVGDQYRILSSEIFLRFILKSAADTNLETYVQFGSHEEFFSSIAVLNYMTDLYGNIIDVRNQQKIEAGDHHLIFLPGSDINAGGEFTFGTKNPSYFYIITDKGLVPFTDIPTYQTLARRGIAQGVLEYYNIQDLENIVTEPEKTIVFCHVPRNFKESINPENSVDIANFYQAVDDFEILTCEDQEQKEKHLILYRFLERTKEESLKNKGISKVISAEKVKKGQIMPREKGIELSKMGLYVPIDFKTDNRGNEDLTNLYQKLGITKSVTGHFHESVHHAHDLSGKFVPEKEFSSELFWMASYLDASKVGLLYVDENKVAYQNLTF